MLLFSLSSNFKHNIQIHPNTQILISFGIWITFGESSLDYQIAGQTDPRFWKSMSLSTPQQPKTAQRFDDFGGRGMTQQPGTAGVSNSHGQSPLPFEPGGPRKRRGHDGHTIGSWKSTSIMSENGDLIGFNGIHEYIYIYIYEKKYIYIYAAYIKTAADHLTGPGVAMTRWPCKELGELEKLAPRLSEYLELYQLKVDGKMGTASHGIGFAEETMVYISKSDKIRGTHGCNKL